MEIDWEFDKEPGVIDESLIYNAVINQGPKGEAGKIFKEQGIEYEKVDSLRLEFYDILKIDNLWTMTSLTSLQLSNNIIEVIENLDILVNLNKLDLSFNKISKIQNLDHLINLEILSLYENKIYHLENMDNLKKLQVFSIGNNRLVDNQDILYLRRFNRLQSLNLAGNPVCKHDNFYPFIYAFLPQLIYYEYRMVSDLERCDAVQLFRNELSALEEEEDRRRGEEENILRDIKQEEMNKKAFVENLGGDQLFTAMFENDTEGMVLLEVDEIMDIYKEYKKNFCAVTKQLHTYALQQFEVRIEEIAEYDKVVKEGKKRVYDESRSITESFLVEKKDLFGRIKEMLDADEDEAGAMAQMTSHIQDINEIFQKLCLRTWHSLMQKELYLFEALEKVNTTFEHTMTQLVNELIEAAQAKFTQLRTLQGSYNEAICETSDRYMTKLVLFASTSNEPYGGVSSELFQLMEDREVLRNANSASHDVHLIVIDTREDQLVSSARSWVRDYVEKIMKAEIERNRGHIIEMNHFLDCQRDELQSMMTSSGLQTLPSEIQDALQIN